MCHRSPLILALVALAPILMAGAAFANPYEEDGSANAALLASTTNCATFLGNNLYSCNLIGELSGPFHDCYQAAPGSSGDEVDLTSLFVGGGPVLACDCNPTGSAKQPKFDASKTAFICDGTTFGLSTALVGKVAAAGQKIVKGALQIGGGQSYVFDCVLDASCTP